MCRAATTKKGATAMKRDGTIQALRATARAWKLLAKKQRGLFPALGLHEIGRASCRERV